MGVYEGFLASELVRMLGPVAWQHKKGRVVGEVLFRIDHVLDLERRPDLAFVSYDRWPAARPVPTENAWNVVPDLAVEVVSKTNLAANSWTRLLNIFGPVCAWSG